jgi:hypothetical protein
LYRLLNSVVDAMNDDISPKLEAVEAQSAENANEIKLVKELVIE